MNGETWSISARWLFPVEGPPIERGVLAIRNGRIEAVLPPGQRTADLDLDNAVILPGLVNAHTHLDLGGLHGFLPSMEFEEWLPRIVAYRRSIRAEDALRFIQIGLEQSLAAGVTLIGDISAGGLSAELVGWCPIRLVVYYELIGLTQSRSAETWSAAREWLGRQKAHEAYRPGLSPHAPYSVRRQLLQQAAAAGVPTAIHLAETRSEELLLEAHGGPLREFLEQLGAWDDSDLSDSFDQVLALIGQARPLALIHGNHLSPHQLHDRTVVVCPRTHGYFRRSSGILRELVGTAATVALGTDSLASNPDLSILGEMRHLARGFPELSPGLILRMGTLHGARALGWDWETGSLSPGKSADFLVLAAADAEPDDPHELIWGSTDAVQAVYVRGVCVQQAQSPTGRNPWAERAPAAIKP